MNIFYRIENKLYVNITNACPCACIFCIRDYASGVGDASSLWLNHTPTLEEIKEAFTTRQDLNEVNEIVFCGYGEPMMRAKEVIEISKFIKHVLPNMPIRINTNGLILLIESAFDIKTLSIVDSISVSLNADDAEEYVRVTKPAFGLYAYDSMLNFVKAAKEYTKVVLTVVNVLEPNRIENCRKIADKLKLPLVVRKQW